MRLAEKISVNNAKSRIENTVKEGVKGKDLKKSSTKKKAGGFRKKIPVYKVVFSYPCGRTSDMDVRCEGDTTLMIRDVSIGFVRMRGRLGVDGCSIKFYNTENKGDDSTKLSYKKDVKVKRSLKKKAVTNGHVRGSQHEKARLFYTIKY